MHSFTDEDIDALYAKYHPMLEGLTNEQKEDKLVDLASNGEISADKALILSVKEGLQM